MIPQNILAIDPGTTESAYVVYDRIAGAVVRAEKLDNNALLDHLNGRTAVIEQVESYGMPVGRDVFETVYWSGRFHQEVVRTGGEVHRVTRREVKRPAAANPPDRGSIHRSRERR